MPAYSIDDFVLYDPTDPTKIFKFSASSIKTGTIRTLAVPDSDLTFTSSEDVIALLDKMYQLLQEIKFLNDLGQE